MGGEPAILMKFPGVVRAAMIPRESMLVISQSW
jgi:hypothetical protein